MTVLLDTDVLIDVALDRLPHAEHSAKILDLAQSGYFEAYLAWHSLSNFYNVVSSESQHKQAMQFINELLTFVKVAETKTTDAIYAVKLNISDFEDALQISAAISCKAQQIVTRNIKHYKRSPVLALLPLDFIQTVMQSG